MNRLGSNVGLRARFVASLCLSMVFLPSSVYGIDLVHRWSFEDNFADSSGSGNDGIGSGTFVPGKFGQALSLVAGSGGLGDGVDNDFANNLPTGGAANWAMSVWVNRSTLADDLEYVAGFGVKNGFGGGDGGKARGMITFGGSDNNNFYFWGGSSDVASAEEYNNDSQWHMYTMTYSAGTLRMYKDAALVQTQAVALTDAPASVHVGNPSNWNNDFDASLDEFAIFNDTLTAAQIGGLYLNNDINQPALLLPTFEVNRTNGEIVLTNNSISAVEVLGYSIKSASGSLKPPSWSKVAGRFDAPPVGDGTVDPNHDWTVLTNTADPFGVELSEAAPPGSDGGTIAIGKVINFGSAWAKNPVEDISIDILLDDGQGTILTLPATFINGDSFDRGDFNADGSINGADWQIFRTAPNATMAGQTLTQAYLGGDMDGDLDKDITDYGLFAKAYDAFNGSGSFAAMAAVPEPGTWALLLVSSVGCVVSRRARHSIRSVAVATKALLALLVVACALPAQAAVNGYYNLNGDADEATGANINLTLQGDATFGGSVSPGLGFALELDGAGDAAIGQAYTKVAGNNLTLVSWVYANDVAGDWDSIVKNWGQTVGGQFHLGLGTNLADTPQNFIGNGTNVAGPDALPTGQWVHVAAVADATALLHRLYVNGAEVASVPYAGTLTQGTATGLGIGAKPNDDGSAISAGAPGFWSGRIDEVGIYDTAMTAAEIQQIYQNGLDGIQLDGTVAPNIHLVVHRGTGVISLVNDTPGAVPLDAYQISSVSGSLLPGNWNSLQEQGIDGFPTGHGTGDGWEQDAASNANQILETYLLGESTLVGGAPPLALGNLFKKSGGQEDLVFQYRTSFGAIITGNVEYEGTSTLLGDVNFDGTVDIFDVNVVSDNWGGSGPTGDANGDGTVDIFDVNVISDNWGATAGGAAAVPEPGTACLALVGLAGFALLRRLRAAR